jgi:protein-S-isoprenylcysteine O-methyltransferase Ste14
LVAAWQSRTQPEGVRGTKGQEEAFVGRQRIVRNFIIAFLYFALFFLPFASRYRIGTFTEYELTRWFGLGVFSLGMFYIVWSGIALGRLYSGDVTLQKDHQLITDGPYRRIRHPRYTGGVLLGIGLSLLFDSWIGLLVLPFYMVVLLFRIRDEEDLMSEAFGEQWRSYCEKTKKLIPFVY